MKARNTAPKDGLPRPPAATLLPKPGPSIQPRGLVSDLGRGAALGHLRTRNSIR